MSSLCIGLEWPSSSKRPVNKNQTIGKWPNIENASERGEATMSENECHDNGHKAACRSKGPLRAEWPNRKRKTFQAGRKTTRTKNIYLFQARALLTLSVFFLAILSDMGARIECKPASKLPDLVSGTNDSPIVVSVGQDAYISCVANNLQNYTIIWRFSNDAHAPGLAADDGQDATSDESGKRDQRPSDKLEDVDASAAILTAGRQRVTSDQRFSVIRSHNTWLLKITAVRMGDTGTYICQTNSEPRVRAIRILTVLARKSQTADGNQTHSLASQSVDLADLNQRGKSLMLDYNFTDCCNQEYVFPRCQKLCSLQQLASKFHTLNIVHECYSALPSITRCMVGGRNVVDCCDRVHVPQRCHSMCGKSSESAMSLSIQDQTYCADYSASIMACVAEGIDTLPAQPEFVIVEAVSSSCLKVSWQRVADESELKKVDGWIINLTKLSSFEDTISTRPATASTSELEGPSNEQTSATATRQQPQPKSLANFKNLLDMRQNSSLAAMTKLLLASNGSVNLKLDKQVNEFSIDNLKPYTVYQIQMFAFNKEGRSQLSDPIRALTLAPENDPATAKAGDNRTPNGLSVENSNDELVEPNLPDTRKCCESRGVTLRKCVDTLCDPIEADRASIEDMMICAPWSNITFSCLSSHVDHSDCCRSRGVTPFCLSMCSGDMKRLDYRHFRCLTHMSVYSNCILESHDVLPSPPLNFTVGPITSSWAVLNWRAPVRRAKSLQGYRIFWRQVESPQPLLTGSLTSSLTSEAGSDARSSPAPHSSLNEVSSAASSSLVQTGSSSASLASSKPSSSFSSPINDDSHYMSAEAATNPYLLDALLPDTVYETYVVAVNKYGQSKPSPHFLFQTLPDETHKSNRNPDSDTPGESLESRLPLQDKAGKQPTNFYNETGCCINSGVPASCRQLCNYDLKVIDGYDLITSCSGHMPAIMRCLAGNRNSVPCCRSRGVGDQCLNVCAGLTEHSPLMVASQCGADFGKILRCLDEGSKQIPSAPLDLHATDVKSDRISLAWKPANEDKFRADIEYHVRFQQLQSSGADANSDESGDNKSDLSALIAVVPLHPLEHNMIISTNKSEATLDKLKPGKRYSLYVTAENSYGISLPSLVLVLETPLRDSDASDQHKRNATLGPPHALEVSRSDTESMVLKWSPPLYIENDAQIRYRVFYKLMGTISSKSQSLSSSEASDSSDASLASGGGEVQQVKGNWVAIETSSTSIPLRNLAYNSQYAITVQAFTRNRRGHMSELLLASTAKPVPPSINPPLIINRPVEGNNITIMCVALGQPTPQISMYINGLIVQKRTQPYIVYHLINLAREPLTITCFASNGHGPDYVSVQSRTEVNVEYGPRALARSRDVRANIQSVARLSCLIQANPQPTVTWSLKGDQTRSESVVVPNERVTTLVVDQYDVPSTWSHTLTIRNISKSDQGSYQCRAVNAFGESKATLDLNVIEPTNLLNGANLTLPFVEANSDLMDCCKSQNVSSKCLPVCSSDGLDIETAFRTPECQSNLDKLMFCAADGSDHRTCCRQRQVPFSCLRWCSGSKLFNIPAICFLSSAMDINQCFQEGRTLLPGPPKNLRALIASESDFYSASNGASPNTDISKRSKVALTTMQIPLMNTAGEVFGANGPSSAGASSASASASGNSLAPIGSMAMAFGDTMSGVSASPADQDASGLINNTNSEPIIIEWDPPTKNSQLVQYYRIFWRPIKSRQLSRTVTNQTWLKLTDLDWTIEYEFVVKAANTHGSSVYSEALTFKPSELAASSVSRTAHWLMDIGHHDSLLGRMIMTITFATSFMFAILVIVLYLEKHGYLSRFASSKSNNSRISFANPSYVKDNSSPDSGQDFSQGTSTPIELTSDSRSLSRGSSEGRGSSSSTNMRFETITWDNITNINDSTTNQAASSRSQLSAEMLELPPMQIKDDNSSSNVSIVNPNYRR